MGRPEPGQPARGGRRPYPGAWLISATAALSAASASDKSGCTLAELFEAVANLAKAPVNKI